MENEPNVLEEITDTDTDTDTENDTTTQQPETSLVDMFISGDMDGARALIHSRTVEIVSALVKKPKIN